MMFCAVCDRDVQPVIDINDQGRPVSMCGKCQSALGTGLQATDQPQAVAGPAAEPQAGPALPRRFEPKPTGPVDLVAQAKARLALIDKELERLTELQRERRKLAAMVAAAESADVDDTMALSVRRAVNGVPAPLPPLAAPDAAE